MKIYFYRNTHDENGNYRGDEYFNLKPEDGDKELFFGAHTWDGSGKKYQMTFSEIVERSKTLLRQGAYDGDISPDDYLFSVEFTLKALAFMIEHRLVVAEIEE